MKFKGNKCPNCGATLKYNSAMRRQECSYCGAVYQDMDKDNADNRVQLSPDELEKMKPINNTNNHNNSKKANDSATKIILAIIIIFFIFPAILQILGTILAFFSFFMY